MLSPAERAELYVYLDNYQMDQLLLEAEAIAHQILPFIQRGIKEYTAHGIGHSMSVIGYVNQMISIMKARGQMLSQTEVKLLYLSCWLHDIGNIRSDRRGDHAIESCAILDRIDERYINLGRLKNSLKYVIKYHQSKFHLEDVPEEVFEIDGDRIRLQLLCPLFRLADACHMGEDRAYKPLFYIICDEFNEESKANWEANRAIQSVRFDNENDRIAIYVSDKAMAKLITDKLCEEFETVKPFLVQYLPIGRVEILEEPRFE